MVLACAPEIEVEDQHEAGGTEQHAEDGQPAGRWPRRSQSQPTTATGAVYSISSATPTCMCCDGVEVRELAAGDGDQAVAARPAGGAADQQQPAAAQLHDRDRRHSTAAASRIRTTTAAADDQPASISPRASEPDSPNDDAESTASPSPDANRVSAPLVRGVSCVNTAMTPDTRVPGCKVSTWSSRMTQTAALQAAVALVNSAEPPDTMTTPGRARRVLRRARLLGVPYPRRGRAGRGPRAARPAAAAAHQRPGRGGADRQPDPGRAARRARAGPARRLGLPPARDRLRRAARRPDRGRDRDGDDRPRSGPTS